MARPGQGDEWAAVRSEYAAWVASPPGLRRQFNMPRSKTEFSELKGVSDRTLRRWQDRDDFKEEVELHRRRIEGSVDGGTVASKVGGARARPGTVLEPRKREPAAMSSPTLVDTGDAEPGISRHELLYRQAKNDVFERAAEGAPTAVELMMKYWGRELLEQEQAEQQLFAQMSDEELLDEVVTLAGEELLVGRLAARAAGE